jgi:hypothetical protein
MAQVRFPSLYLFLFSIVSIPPVGPIQLPIQWTQLSISPQVKRPGREADNSPPSSAEVESGGAVPPLLHMCSWHTA